tara:strand:+ start:249 stop:1112 length:864 start_codon:yes stop_codon:yes gene_type:complete
MSEICASCLDFDINKIVKSKDSLAPKWLSEKDYVQEFIMKSNVFSNYHPKDFDVKMKLDIGKQYYGKKILYWAAKKNNNNNLSINDAKTSYGNFSNSGVASVDKNGVVVLKFSCPQIYRTTPAYGSKSQSYYRHLHFVISNSEKDKWMEQIYTKIVVCKFGLKESIQMLKSGNYVFINALTCEYYGKDHIPNTYNLTHKQVKKMNQRELHEWFKQVVKLHYPNIHKEITLKTINVKEIPIVAYCAHEKCNASELLLEELLKKGMVNVYDYSGGMKEYRKRQINNKLF